MCTYYSIECPTPKHDATNTPLARHNAEPNECTTTPDDTATPRVAPLTAPQRATFIGRCQSPKALAKRLRYRGFRGYPPKSPGEYCRIRLDIGLLILRSGGDVQFLGHDAGMAKAELTGLLESEVAR
ncbi:MAG: hypothetical protein MI924_00495 [Chloroflexales bacterium]|nr:hypothetical protein [Chloroflexales bacterium]